MVRVYYSGWYEYDAASVEDAHMRIPTVSECSAADVSIDAVRLIPDIWPEEVSRPPRRPLDASDWEQLEH